MTEDRAPYAVPKAQPQMCQNDDVKWLALTLRRAFLFAIREIERKYPDAVKQERNAA